MLSRNKLHCQLNITTVIGHSVCQSKLMVSVLAF